jgi:glycosyltransferase involved in cell wall biosynthesis
VVVTDAGHGSEAVRDHENGLFAAPEPSSIAEKVDLVVRDRRMALELGRSAKRTVDSEFSWDRTAERYLRCYASEA